MEVIWNQIDIQRPPSRQWKISGTEFNIKQFIDCLNQFIKDLNNEVLQMESALISRMIYRMKQKFRNDKGFKYMERVNKSLLICLNSSIQKDYEFIRNYVDTDNGFISLPSKQMMHYILVKTQGFAKVLYRIEETTKIAANLFKTRIGLGHAWSVAIIAYAVLSRIWVLSRFLIKKICTAYENIYNYGRRFKYVGVPWLPDNYVLPINLRTWLNISWWDEDLESLPEVKDQTSIFNLIDTSTCINAKDILTSVSSDDEIVDSSMIPQMEEENKCHSPITLNDVKSTEELVTQHTSTSNKKGIKVDNNQSRLSHINDTEHIGESISRKDFGHKLNGINKRRRKNELSSPVNIKKRDCTKASSLSNDFKRRKKKKNKAQ